MFEFCQTDIPTIKCFFIPQCVTEKEQFALLSRHKMRTTMQGTKCLDYLEKISSNGIKFKQPSKDPKTSGSTCSKNIPNNLQSE